MKGVSVYIYIFLLCDFLRLENIGESGYYARSRLHSRILAINPFRRREEEDDYITTFISSESKEGVNLDARNTFFFEQVEFIG